MDSVVPRHIYEETILDFFAPVRLYLDDPSVTEIMINGHAEIFIERAGRIERTDARFGSRHELMSAVRNMAQYVGRHADEHRPILEGRFPDGSRVEAILPPASPDGPTVSIRRFSRDPLTIDMLLGYGALTHDLAETVRVIVACKQNIIVAGGTASGKTSMLNAVSSFIDPAERVVVIEDARELRLQLPHVVQLESQPPDARGRGQVSIRDLFRATLRVRPDRIIVGEVRGAESLDLIQAMTSGHGGCLSTVHATHPLDTLNRLETTALMSDVALPLYALRSQVASAIDFVLHTARLGDGTRCVTQLSEVVGYDPTNGYDFRDIFRREYHGRNEKGRIRSTLAPTGKLPQCIDLIRGLGLELPAAVLSAARATQG
jgi:pilus assembly protein CpaF